MDPVHISTAIARAVSRVSPSVSAKVVAPIRHDAELPALFIPEIDRELVRLVAWWEGGDPDTGSPGLRRPFNADEQGALERRVESLLCAIAPMEEVDRDELLAAIAAMLNGFPMMQRLDEIAAISVVAGYLWTVRARPPWAILKACQLVRSGEAGLNTSFCPSEPDFSRLVARCVEGYANALRRTQRLQGAKIETRSPAQPAAMP